MAKSSLPLTAPAQFHSQYLLTWTFSLKDRVKNNHNNNIPVPHDWGGSSGSGGLQGLHPRQNLQRTVEQLVDIPVPGGGPDDISDSEQSHPHRLMARMRIFTRFFAKVWPAGHCQSRRALQLMDASGL